MIMIMRVIAITMQKSDNQPNDEDDDNTTYNYKL